MGALLQNLGLARQMDPLSVGDIPLNDMSQNPGERMFGMPAQMAGPGGFSPQAPAPMPTTPQDVAAAIKEGFKPKKRSILGILGDAFLMNQGKQPLFYKKMEEKNLRRAMDGFTDNPLESIKRIATFNPELAWKMYDTYQDNSRAASQQDRLMKAYDFKLEEAATGRVMNMLGAANSSNWKAIRDRAQSYMQKQGYELPFDLPEEYDEDFVNSARMGQIPVAKQVQLEDTREYRERGLDIRESRTNSQNARDVAMTQQGEARVGQGQARVNETIRHNQRMESITESKGSKSSGAKDGSGRQADGSFRQVRPNGDVVTISPDGSRAVIKRGGKFYQLKKDANGKMQLVK